MSGTGTAGERGEVAGGVVPTKSPTIGSADVLRASRLERASDPLVWVWCGLAYRAVMVLPLTWRLSKWLLPFAGYYAYATPRRWRWSERVR